MIKILHKILGIPDPPPRPVELKRELTNEEKGAIEHGMEQQLSIERAQLELRAYKVSRGRSRFNDR